MFNRRIGGRDDREFQLRALGFPPRLTGRGVAAVRRKPGKLPLYLARIMERTDTVTIDAAVLDRVAASLKRSYDELKEARMVARSRAETTVSSPVAARSPAAVSPWKTDAVPPTVPTCSHCGMDPTFRPSPAVLKRAATIVNIESHGQSPRTVRQSPRTAPKQASQLIAEPKSKRACFQESTEDVGCSCVCLGVSRSCVPRSHRYCRYRQRIGRGQYIQWVSMKHPSHSQNIPPIPSTARPDSELFHWAATMDGFEGVVCSRHVANPGPQNG